jgi:hypothetical protein
LVGRIESGQQERRRCNVADFFAGIGTGIVVLKRLGIDIAKVSTVSSTSSDSIFTRSFFPCHAISLPCFFLFPVAQIIHCEHDKVATHVYRHNHDRIYNTNLLDDGGIEHVFYRKFEEINGNVDAFMNEHGRT